MPAVVRGGRRQSSNQPPRKTAPRKTTGARQARGGQGGQAAPAKLAALGGLDLSPRAVIVSCVCVAALAGVVLFAGSRADRIGAAVADGVHGRLAAMGMAYQQSHVVGASSEARPAIDAAIQLTVGQPITAINLDEVRQRVEQVGWVSSARVVRLLPGTIMVTVVEHDRQAVWRTAGRSHVIDGQGRVIEGADPDIYPELPLVVGMGAEQAASDILPLLRQRPRLMGRVEALVRVDERRWDLRLKDGRIIQLPASGQESALIRLDAMDQNQQVLDRAFVRLDLRTPEAATIRPAEASA